MHKKTKYCINIILLVLVCLSLVGCRKKTTPQVEEVTLRLKWLVQAHSAGEIIASSTGLCEKEGFQCTIKSGGPDFDSIKLVASGKDQYGVTSADQLLLARSKGIPIVAIGVLFQESPVCFFAKKKWGLKTPQDFLGKTVGVKYGTNGETEFVVLLKRAGIDRKMIKEVPVKFDLRPFFLGQVDVWPGLESNEPITASENGFEVDVLRSRDLGIKTYSNVYFTTEKRIREHPDQVYRFMKAMAAGWKFVRDNPDAAIEAVLSANSRLDKEHERKSLMLTLPIIFPDNNPSRFGQMTLEGWKETQSVLLDANLLKKPLDLDKCFYIPKIHGGEEDAK